MRRNYKYSIAFIGWLCLVTFLSLYSFRDPDAPRFEISHFDKIVHFIFYFVACILGVFFLRERTRSRITISKAILYMVLFTISFGGLIEVLQHNFTMTREGDVLDVLANTLGSLFGALISFQLFTKWGRYQW